MTIIDQEQTESAYHAIPSTDQTDKTESIISQMDLNDTASSKGSLVPINGREAPRLGTLSRNTHSSWYFIAQGAVDAILAVGPIFFFIIAGLCIGLHGQPTAPYGDKIKAVTLLSPTIFPIVYAAILGNLLRRIGLFKAERGTTMGDLERLIGCQSIFSTLERHVGMRRVDLLGISILVAWLLSPLGGQASLRLLSVEPLYTDSDSTVFSLPVRMYTYSTALPLRNRNLTASPFFAPLFVAALQTSRLSLKKPMDLFGNIRIPDYNSLNTTNITDSDNSWRTVPAKLNTSYTSIFGIPVAGIPAAGTTSFSLVSHYWAIDCDRNPSRSAWKQISPPNDSKLAELKTLSASFDIIVDAQNNSDTNIKFRYLSRTTANLTMHSVVSLECSASPIVVESMVDCRDGACVVLKMRRSEAVLSSLWNALKPPRDKYTSREIFQAIVQRLPGVDISATQDTQYGSELVERWMLSPELNLIDKDAGFLDLSLLERAVFIQRLQMAINTFWDSTVGSELRMGNLDPSIVRSQTPIWDNEKIRVTKNEGLHYVCHFRLAGITMAIAFILLLAANLSMLLGLITRTPDALGFVSMAARDNPYFKRYVPSHLDGKEAARLLRDVRVIVGDVGGDGEVGHIALTTMDADTTRLSWKKYYD